MTLPEYGINTTWVYPNLNICYIKYIHVLAIVKQKSRNLSIDSKAKSTTIIDPDVKSYL